MKERRIVYTGFARFSDLQAMSRLDKSTFPQYSHVFSADSVRRWYEHNPQMFLVTRDEAGKLVGFGTIVPVNEILFGAIISGQMSSLVEFPESQVFKRRGSPFYHIEVIVRNKERRDHAGLDLLQAIANILIARARFVTTSPITPAGERLCRYFGFRMIGRDRGVGNYPIYLLEVRGEWLTAKIRALGRQGLGGERLLTKGSRAAFEGMHGPGRIVSMA
jgi:hypothetical protein